MSAQRAATLLVLAGVVAIGGYFAGWYGQVFWYDMFVHAFSIFAITYAVGVWLYGRDRAMPASAGAVLATLTLMGLGIGAAWEIAEFTYDRWTGPANVIRGKQDTIIDLSWDTAGAFAAALWIVSATAPRVSGTAVRRAG